MKNVLSMNAGSGRFLLVTGDLTTSGADAIVNAANPSLAGGGGVDGAIHKAAGPELLAACLAITAKRGPLPTGQAVLTPGFRLAAKYVIHTVGPIWRGGDRDEPALLEQSYQNCLALAHQHALASIAFPAISCGAYGFPLALAAPIALRAIKTGLMNNQTAEARLYAYSAASIEIWSKTARDVFGE